MKRGIITFLMIVGMTSANAGWFGSNNSWDDYDDNDWPEWTPMYWMEEMMDEWDNDDNDDFYRYHSGYYQPYYYGVQPHYNKIVPVEPK